MGADNIGIHKDAIAEDRAGHMGFRGEVVNNMGPGNQLFDQLHVRDVALPELNARWSSKSMGRLSVEPA